MEIKVRRFEKKVSRSNDVYTKACINNVIHFDSRYGKGSLYADGVYENFRPCDGSCMAEDFPEESLTRRERYFLEEIISIAERHGVDKLKGIQWDFLRQEIRTSHPYSFDNMLKDCDGKIFGWGAPGKGGGWKDG